jgi:hypothetical protein
MAGLGSLRTVVIEANQGAMMQGVASALRSDVRDAFPAIGFAGPSGLLPRLCEESQCVQLELRTVRPLSMDEWTQLKNFTRHRIEAGFPNHRPSRYVIKRFELAAQALDYRCVSVVRIYLERPGRTTMAEAACEL